MDEDYPKCYSAVEWSRMRQAEREIEEEMGKYISEKEDLKTKPEQKHTDDNKNG